MADTNPWSFPTHLQPDLAGQPGLAAALEGIVGLRAEVPDDAFTALVLGTERQGSGVVIRDDGVVLTIGYLITEATTIWLTTQSGVVVPACPLAYDQATGFGLVQPLGVLDAPAVELGTVEACRAGDAVVVASHGGVAHALKAEILALREFAGYWEYVLDEAVFTTPAHPEWSGAALLDPEGRLLGVGSLLVQEQVDGKPAQGNMMVPIDLLPPILDELLAQGRTSRLPRPWLGLYATESDGQVVVGGVAEGGPAHQMGVRPGDLVLEVDGGRVVDLADLFRRVWQLGPAGIEVPLTLAREGARVSARLRSADRNDFLKKPQLH